MIEIFKAVGDGFSSFFSIWQVCILQISPFFLAYVTGLYFATVSLRGEASIRDRVIVPGLSFTFGFIVIYALLTMTGLQIGRLLVYNLGMLGFFAGCYILLASLSLLLAGRVRLIGLMDRWLVVAVFSLILGISFAFVYSPCITPALSEIMGMAGRSETSMQGGILAFFYGLGICLALTLTGVVLVFVLSKTAVVVRFPASARNFCGLILAVLAILNLSGTMIYYKAFALGFLVQ